MRVLTWNLNCFSSRQTASKVGLLADLEWDIACLQEVSPAAWTALVQQGFTGAYSVDLIGAKGGRGEHGVAVATNGRWVLESPQLASGWVDGGLPNDENRLIRCVASDGLRRIDVISFHAPHAAGGDDRRLRKMAAYRALAAASARGGDQVVGMDSNSWSDELDGQVPAADHPFFEELAYFGTGAEHGLVDVFHEWLRQHPAELERLRAIGAEGPDGALAVTHNRSSRNHPRVNRMDRILATGGVSVAAVDHLYTDALRAGSDHAVVVAEFTWP